MSYILKDYSTIIITIFSVVFTIFVKVISRKDNNLQIKMEDLAIGMSLMINSFTVFISSLSFLMPKILSNGNNIEYKQGVLYQVIFIPIVIIIAIFVISTTIRKLGWKDSELNFKYGVIFPNIVGILVFIMVVIWINIQNHKL
jgi:hypothetical protein